MHWGWVAWATFCCAGWWYDPFYGYLFAGVAGVLALDLWYTKRGRQTLISKRAPVPFDDFLTLLGPKDVRVDIAKLIWEELQDALRLDCGTEDFPLHPDDDLLKTLKFHPDDIYMDLDSRVTRHFNLDGSDSTCSAIPYSDPKTLTPRALINFFSTLPSNGKA